MIEQTAARIKRTAVEGIKEVVKWLNSRGYRTRKGKTFGVGTIYKILTSTTYMSEWKFNRMSSRTGDGSPMKRS